VRASLAEVLWGVTEWGRDEDIQACHHAGRVFAVFAVIAVALVKIAFVDGMKSGPSVAGPAAEVTTPVVEAKRATVTNTVQVAFVSQLCETRFRSTEEG
jgi:hypothetical protein